ncbi:MAG: hypothetical protein R3B84_17570 [Zavarzinella sp.]
MTPIAEIDEDADVPALAVKALNEATEQALRSGKTVVLVRDGKLVRIEGGNVIVLKELHNAYFSKPVHAKKRRNRSFLSSKPD